MKKKFIFLLAACALAACQPKPQTAPDAPQARVGSQVVSQQDVLERLPFLSSQDQAFAQTPLGRQNLLQIIAREKLIQQAAVGEGLDKTNEYRSLLTQKRAQLDKIYHHYTLEVLENLWYEKQRQSGGLQVTEAEIDSYYKQYPYEMTLRQIVVDNAQTADQLLRALKSSPRRWKELSRQYNKAPESLREDFSFMPGEFLPDIEAVAANSPVGSVQGFFKTAQGFHIIMKTGEKRLSRDQARPRIQAVLENKKLDAILENLQNKYEVVIYDKTE